jgi:plasmid maintenance system antidote protein VapI
MSKTCQDCKWFKLLDKESFGLCGAPAPRWAYLAGARPTIYLDSNKWPTGYNADRADLCFCFEDHEVKETVNEYDPDNPSPPGQTLLDLFEEGKLTRQTLGWFTELSEEELDDLLSGKMPIDESLAQDIADAAGTDGGKEFWINRERSFRNKLKS